MLALPMHNLTLPTDMLPSHHIPDLLYPACQAALLGTEG